MSLHLEMTVNSSPNEKMVAQHPDEVSRKELLTALATCYQLIVAAGFSMGKWKTDPFCPPLLAEKIGAIEDMVVQAAPILTGALGADCTELLLLGIAKSYEERFVGGGGTKGFRGNSTLLNVVETP